MLLALAFTMPLRATNLCNMSACSAAAATSATPLLCDISPMYLICLPAAAVCGLALGLGIRTVYLWHLRG
jgi:hypothetical protein